MSEESKSNTMTISLMGKKYCIKCPPEKMLDLQEAALFLDKKMQEIRNSGKLVAIEKIAVIAALNVAHELLGEKRETEHYINQMGDQIKVLVRKVEDALEETTPPSMSSRAEPG